MKNKRNIIEINKYSLEERLDIMDEMIQHKIDVEEYEDIPYLQELRKDVKSIRFADETSAYKTNTKFSIVVLKYIRDMVKDKLNEHNN